MFKTYFIIMISLLAAQGAHSAELPNTQSGKTSPPQKLIACPEAGAGYFRMAGSSTCVKIGGYVEIDTSSHRGQISHGDPSSDDQ